MTFAVPTNADVVRSAHQIERALGLLGCDVAVTPLMSPRSVLTVAEAAAGRTTPNGPAPIGFGPGSATGAPWPPPRPPTSKSMPGSPGRSPAAAAPLWMPAAAARNRRRLPVARFLRQVRSRAGRLHGGHHRHLARQPARRPAPRTRGRRPRRHRPGHRGGTHPAPQPRAGHRRGRLLPAHRPGPRRAGPAARPGRPNRHPAALLDTEFSAAFGRVHEDVDASVRDACSAPGFCRRTTSATCTTAASAPHPRHARPPRGPSRHWVIPRRWDAWLTARLFGLDKETPVTDEQLKMFTSLFAGETCATARRARVSSGSSGPAYGPSSAAARKAGPSATSAPAWTTHLRARSPTSGTRSSAAAAPRHPGADPVPPVPADGQHPPASPPPGSSPPRRSPTPSARTAGGGSPPPGRSAAWSSRSPSTTTTPATSRPGSTTAAFGGDPHVYTVSLGDTTALALAGTRRIVLGLSATAYFPFAPHYHVHPPPLVGHRRQPPHRHHRGRLRRTPGSPELGSPPGPTPPAGSPAGCGRSDSTPSCSAFTRKSPPGRGSCWRPPPTTAPGRSPRACPPPGYPPVGSAWRSGPAAIRLPGPAGTSSPTRAGGWSCPPTGSRTSPPSRARTS